MGFALQKVTEAGIAIVVCPEYRELPNFIISLH